MSQQSTPEPPQPPTSGSSGNSWLNAAIAIIVVAAIYFVAGIQVNRAFVAANQMKQANQAVEAMMTMDPAAGPALPLVPATVPTNTGDQVPPAYIQSVDECQQKANVVILAANPALSGAGTAVLQIDTGMTSPNASATTITVDETSASWSTTQPGMTFCEVIEWTDYRATGYGSTSEYGGTSWFEPRTGTWGHAANYKFKAGKHWNMIVVIGYDSSLEPGKSNVTGLLVGPDGQLRPGANMASSTE